MLPLFVHFGLRTDASLLPSFPLQVIFQYREPLVSPRLFSRTQLTHLILTVVRKYHFVWWSRFSESKFVLESTRRLSTFADLLSPFRLHPLSRSFRWLRHLRHHHFLRLHLSRPWNDWEAHSAELVGERVSPLLLLIFLT